MLTVRDALRETGPDGRFQPIVNLALATGGVPIEFVFETTPLDAPLRLVGRPTVELNATTDTKTTHWVVHLIEIAPDGTATLINRGYLDTRHRDGVKAPPATSSRANPTTRRSASSPRMTSSKPETASAS